MPKCRGLKPGFIRCSKDAMRGKWFCHSHRNQPRIVLASAVVTVALGLVANFLWHRISPRPPTDKPALIVDERKDLPPVVVPQQTELTADAIYEHLREMPVSEARDYARKKYLSALMQVTLNKVSSHEAFSGKADEKTGKYHFVHERERWEGVSAVGIRFSCMPNEKTLKHIELGNGVSWDRPIRGRITEIKVTADATDQLKSSIELITLDDCFFPHLK